MEDARTPRLPWFKFYAYDYQSDHKIALCSLQARGFWLEILCALHASPVRGSLSHADGRPWSDNAIAVATRSTRKQVRSCIAELVTNGVLDKDEAGVLSCPRMVKDEWIRRIRMEAGRKGGLARSKKTMGSFALANALAKSKQESDSVSCFSESSGGDARGGEGGCAEKLRPKCDDSQTGVPETVCGVDFTKPRTEVGVWNHAASSVLAAYPRKTRSPGQALAAACYVLSDLRSGAADKPPDVPDDQWPPSDPLAWLVARTAAYAAARKGHPVWFTPAPHNWLEKGGWCADPEAWYDDSVPSENKAMSIEELRS